MYPPLTAELLRSYLHYDPDTGIFTWLVDLGTARIGRQAGVNRKDGYRMIRVNKRLYYAHRLAWLWMIGEWPSKEIDHIDCNPANNRWVNIRAASRKQNLHNASIRRSNSSGYKGISRSGNGYVARLNKVYLGWFKCPKEAHRAYCEAAVRVNGEFARSA